MLSSICVRTFVDTQIALCMAVVLAVFILSGCADDDPQMPPPSNILHNTSTHSDNRLPPVQHSQNDNNSDERLLTIRGYLFQEPLLEDEQDHQDNIDNTWQTLTQFTPQQLNELVINTDENVLQAWLDLVKLYHDSKQNQNLLRVEMREWQTRHPLHPAVKNLPTPLKQKINFIHVSTDKIALLLPLSGSAKVFGEAIRQGFLDAHSGLTVVTMPMPTVMAANDDVNPDQVDHLLDPVESVANTTTTFNPQVKIYDTESQPVAEILALAQQEGATLVVGPLLKPEVAQLATIATTLNILALNHPEESKTSTNICYFSLSPKDEARNAAHHLWQKKKQTPLLITPQGIFGDAIAYAFTQEWHKLGGQTVLQQRFASMSKLKQAINRGQGIRLSGQPVSPLPGSPPVTAAMGNHVDAVYIVATPGEMTLIKPMIEMTTDSPTKPELFTSSRSNQTNSSRKNNNQYSISADYYLEMEGIQFSEIPLIAGSNPALMKQAADKYNNDYSLIRLYAMGIDAWALANYFAEVRQIAGFHLSGTTGDLNVTTDCVISRKLPWLQYRQGKLIPAI